MATIYKAFYTVGPTVAASAGIKTLMGNVTYPTEQHNYDIATGTIQSTISGVTYIIALLQYDASNTLLKTTYGYVTAAGTSTDYAFAFTADSAVNSFGTQIYVVDDQVS